MKTFIPAMAIILAMATGTYAAMPIAGGLPATTERVADPDGANRIRNITVGPFDKIENTSTCKVIYTQKDGAPTVTVSAPEGIIGQLDISVENGTLTIDRNGTNGFGYSDNYITVRVSSPSLTAATIESASAMEINGPLSTPSFFLNLSGASSFRADAIDCKDMTADIDGASSAKISKADAGTAHLYASGASRARLHLNAATATFDISGASHIELSGTASHAEYLASGTSSIDAAALKADHARAQASGMSRVECNAVVSLDSEQSEMATIINNGNANAVAQNGAKATQQPTMPQQEYGEEPTTQPHSRRPDNNTIGAPAEALSAQQPSGDTAMGAIAIYGICGIAVMAVAIGVFRRSRPKSNTRPTPKPESNTHEPQEAAACAEEAESPAATNEKPMPSLASLPVVQKITRIINDKTDRAGRTAQEKLTADDWAALDKGVNMIYPGFKQRLLAKKLSEQEYHICLLTKIGAAPADIARLTCKDRAAISNARSRLYKKFFGQKGNGEAWDEFIRSL